MYNCKVLGFNPKTNLIVLHCTLVACDLVEIKCLLISYPSQLLTFLLGPSTNLLNVLEALSSPKIVSLNQFRKVLLCSFNTLFLAIFGLLSLTKASWQTMDDKTSLLLFNIYKWSCGNSFRPKFITCSPHKPLFLTLLSCRDSGSPTYFGFSMYSEQNLITSFVMYLSKIDASRQCRFFIYHFKNFMYRSTGYIHRKKMGSHDLIFLTRWIIKWIVMSKNKGGKYISNWHKIIATSFSKSSNFKGSITLLHMTLKKKHRWVMACLTLLGKMSWIAMTSSCCIKTWQSWDFKPTNFRSFNYTRLLIFEEYPCDTLTQHWHWQKLSSPFLTKYDILEASIFCYHKTLDVTSHVYLSQLDLDVYSNHPLSCLEC